MKNIKMGPKLISSYLLITFVAVCVCAYLLTQLSKVNDGTNELYDKGILSLKNVGDANQLVQMIRVEVRGAFISSSPEEREVSFRRLDSIETEILRIYSEEEKKLTGLSGGKGKAAVENVRRAMKDYDVLMTKFKEKSRNGTLTSIPKEMYEKVSEIISYNRNFSEVKEMYADRIDKASVETYKNAVRISIIILILMAVFSIIIGIYMTFSVTKPLNKVMLTLKKGEEGDMRVRADVNQKDEIGMVSDSVNEFFEKIQKILKNLHINSDTLAGASEELSSVSKQLASGAEETVVQSNAVASTTEQMAVNINAMASGVEQASVNANDVAGAAEQMSTNMNTVAAAVEEMSASISQISNNTNEVQKIATSASNKAENATNAMNKLGIAAKEIGQVTDVIKKIADKTNLLALNATIEAASAGEAGKGFAVVAGEIKELANQSAQSADDIAHRIDSIQTGTSDAVDVIHDVSDIIKQINHSVEAIAGHVDQQTKASNEIASNVAQANAGARRVAEAIGDVAKGANDVSRNAGEAARGATNVSGSIIGMSQAAKESAQGANQVNQSAGDLARIAGELKHTVDQFKV